ncbi:MAG: 6-carboxytetrahydropterin synthase, partial [Bdellovibrionaceae bacterium]|nr:6-carboxytetrahydropterin synthase [Pseudobdellovibrionaceae bacterium]
IEEINKKLREVAACLDHRHLNHDIAEFKTTIPTTENIALWILQRLTAYRKHLRSLRLYEMDDLWVEVIP